MSLAEILQLGAITGSGLIAGVFFAFSTFVMRALARVPAAEGIRVMQAINKTVITPLFLLVFIGTALVALTEGIRACIQFDHQSILSLIAVLCYVLGTFAVTIICNVPMNDRLAKLNAEDPASAVYWLTYLQIWTRWNHIRTISPVVALVCWSLL